MLFLSDIAFKALVIPNKREWNNCFIYIEEIVSTSCLGVQIDKALKWDHLDREAKSLTQKLNLIWFLFWGYFALSYVWYVSLIWSSCGQVLFSNLESIHVRAAKIIFNLDWCTPGKEVPAKANWNTLEIMHEKRLLILAHQAYYLLPCPMNCLFVGSYNLRRKMTLKLLRPKTDRSRNHDKSVIRWNALDKPNENNSWH